MPFGMNRTFLLAVVLSLFCIHNQASAQREFTLENCLVIAYHQAPQLIQAKRNYEIASANAEASNRALRSTVDLTLSAPVYTDNTLPVYNTLTGTFDLARQYESEFGGALTITQPIYWTGGSIAVSGNMFKRQQQPIGSPLENDFLGFASVQLNQPLFKPNELRMSTRESEIALDLAKANYLTQVTALEYNIKSSFYNLYETQQELKIKHDEVDASQSAYDNGQNKYKAGLIAEVDALQLEADLAAAKTDLFDLERKFEAAQRDLMLALGYPLSEKATARLDSISEIN